VVLPGIAAFNAPIAGVLFAIEVCCRCEYCSLYSIMIAAATGVVSVIALDEEILLSFKTTKF
jgi:H+/Cl- antiporter ClcA